MLGRFQGSRVGREGAGDVTQAKATTNGWCGRACEVARQLGAVRLQREDRRIRRGGEEEEWLLLAIQNVSEFPARRDNTAMV